MGNKMDTSASTDPVESSMSNTQIWASRASSFLAEAPELANIAGAAEELAIDFESLPTEERRKVRELSELMSRARCEAPVLAHLNGDGKFEITGSEDRMSLLLSVTPPLADGAPVDVNMIVERLGDNSNAGGVDMEALREATRAASAGQEIHDAVIARGRLPEAGRGESCVLFGRAAADQPLLETHASEQGSSLGMPWTCQAGDRILLRIPAEAGIDGYDAHGVILPAPAPPKLHIEAGQNVRVEGEFYFAEIDGVILNSYGYRIQVRPQLVISHDITGGDPPIDFPGELCIRGALRDGAVVAAKGDITIDGVVEGATITSRQGSITLHRGMVGRGRGVITAKEDVVAQFAENATVLAGNNITLHGGAMNCRLVAGLTVVLDGRKGRIIGGTTLAGERIVALQAGSPGGVQTELCVGLSTEAMKQVAEIDLDIAATRLRLEEAVELVGAIVRAVGRPEDLPAPRLELYAKLCQSELVCTQRIRQAGRRRQEVLERGAQDQNGSIDIQRKIFPGVTVRIGSAVHRHKEPGGGCRFGYDKHDGRVIVRPLH